MTSINTNISAYFAQNNLRSANSDASSSIGRLSSGNRIVKASDDVAGLSVGTVLRTTVSTLRTALQNTGQASSLLQVADGGLQNIGEILQRQKALATQATSGSLSAAERGFLNQEFQSLTDEIDRLVDNTKFNQVTLLDGRLSGTGSLTKVPSTARASEITATNGVQVAGSAIFDFIKDGAEVNGTAASGEFQFTDNAGTALTAAQLRDLVDPSLVGDISGNLSVVDFEADTSATLQIEFGGRTLQTTIAHNGTSAIFDINDAYSIEVTVTAMDTTDANTLAAAVATTNDDLEGAELLGHFEVPGFTAAGTQFEGVTNLPILRLSDTSDVSIKNFQFVTEAAAGANNNVMSVEIGGRTFTAINVPDDIGTGTTDLNFVNGNEVLHIDFTGATGGATIFDDIHDDLDQRAAFVDALNSMFTNEIGGIDFQTGNSVDDAITVSIGGVGTNRLFNGGLDISTVAGAQAAGDSLDEAIEIVTAVRADVGALQSRFDFAAANLETSIQNVDAARANFLDADISEEATNFAQAQVKLQASISVLAQANQLPQNLLKLIG